MKKQSKDPKTRLEYEFAISSTIATDALRYLITGLFSDNNKDLKRNNICVIHDCSDKTRVHAAQTLENMLMVTWTYLYNKAFYANHMQKGLVLHYQPYTPVFLAVARIVLYLGNLVNCTPDIKEMGPIFYKSLLTEDAADKATSESIAETIGRFPYLASILRK